MAGNKDRRHHHTNNKQPPHHPYLHRQTINGTTSNLNRSSNSSSSLLPSSHSHHPSSPSPPPSSTSRSPAAFSQDDDAPIAAAAFSKKKLKVILKLPPHTSKPLPTSSSPPLSSPSSDPYGSSPSHFSDHHATTTSVTSASKKIPPPSSTPPFPTSRRSALPLPAVASGKVPATLLSSLATTSAPSSAIALAPATRALSTPLPHPYRANSATSALASAIPVASDDEGAEKPSKKRRLRAVTDAQNANLLESSSHQSSQRKQAFPSQVGITLPTSSDPPDQKLSSKEKSKEDNAGAEICSSTTPELVTQPSPSKKVLEEIVENLQKKDTFGVFSQPVDPKEVPDYYDVIKNPMDFGTILKKISEGAYDSIHIFQKDIFLICSNAMRYNARHTVYYKQARSIQDTAQKLLEALRSGAPIDEEQLTMKNRTDALSTKKFLKKQSSGRPLIESTVTNHMFGAIPAGDWPSEAPNAERLITPERSGSADYRNSETHPKRGLFGDYQSDLAGLSRTAVPKDSKRLLCDENRRNTYKPCNSKVHENRMLFSPLGNEPLRLVPMGYHHEYAYAKSLARFAADLGPVVWRIAAQKIKRTLPHGLPFGPGWIGEEEVPGGANLVLNGKERDQMPQQMQMKVAENGSGRHSDQQIHAVKSRVGVEGSPVGANLQLDGKERYQTPQQMQMKLTDPGSGKHLDQQVPKASRDYISKCSTDIEMSSSPRTAVSVFPPSFAFAQKELPNINCSMPKTEPAESTMDPSIPPVQSGVMDPIKLSLTGGNYATDMSQSKLLEMVSRNGRLAPWATGNPNENSVTSQSCIYPDKHGVQDRNFETSDSVNLSISSSGIGSGTIFSKHAFILQSERDLFSGTSQGTSLQKSGSERQQTSQALLSCLNYTSGLPSKVFSPVDPSVCNINPFREDRRVRSWVHSQVNDLSNAGSKGRESSQNELPGNSMRNQPVVSTPLISQYQDSQSRQSQLKHVGNMQFQHSTQIRLGQGQHDYQARGASPQHENQRPPALLHHRFLSDMPPFVQLSRLHQQPSAKPAPLIQSRGLSNCNLQDGNSVNLQSGFPIPMVAGVPSSLTQQWRFVPLQYPLQQCLSRSEPPDLNVSLQTPKSPLDQPSNSLIDSQQPDLSLQL